MILSTTNHAALSARAAGAGTDVPAVFTFVIAPVQAGVVDDLRQPGGNITGVRNPLDVFVGKRIEFALQMVPNMKRLWVPYNPNYSTVTAVLTQLRRDGAALGVELVETPVDTPADVIAALDEYTQAEIDFDAIIIFPDMTVQIPDSWNAILSFAGEHNLPILANTPGQVEQGALFSYLSDNVATGEQAARLVHQILQGTVPADLPVETAEQFLTINLQTAQALGLDVPDAVLRQADTVIRESVIKLVENPWEAAQLNTTIARILLEEELGLPVEVVLFDSVAQWESIANGEAHVSLEVWPSGHIERAHEYIGDSLTEQKRIEHGGPLGPMGRIGWYIPAYLHRAHPELATWEGLQDPANVALFTTVETGNKGRFLSGDPAWVTIHEDIIKNLDLDFEVVYAGSETAEIAILEEAFDKQEAILYYFWTPHWAFVPYDMVRVTLPPYSEECYAKADTGGTDCDYPEEPLYKIFWSGFSDYAPRAYQFLKNFNYSNLDQIMMMAMMKLENKSIEEAARLWIAENESVWREWIP